MERFPSIYMNVPYFIFYNFIQLYRLMIVIKCDMSDFIFLWKFNKQASFRELPLKELKMCTSVYRDTVMRIIIQLHTFRGLIMSCEFTFIGLIMMFGIW